jgi:PAS domain S-box-containing protein
MQTSSYRFLIILISIFILMCLVVGSTLNFVKFFHQLSEDLSKIDGAITKSEHTMKLLVDMETGQRGFLVGGQDEFLDPYRDGKKDLEKSFSEVANLIQGDAYLERRLDNAHHLYEQWKANAAAEIELKSAKSDYITPFNTRLGKNLMDQMRREFDIIINTEQLKRSAIIDTADMWWPRILWGTSGVALVAILVIGAMLERLRRQFVKTEDRERLINLAHDAIIVRDTESRVISWNMGATRLYEYSSEDALGKVTHKLLETKFPTKFPDSPKEVDQHLENDGQWEGRLEHRGKGDAVVVVESRQVLLRDADHKPTAILEINRDITESELVLMGVNHDLRNPLTTIINSTRLAILDQNLEDVNRRLVTIATQADAMKKLIDDVLVIFKPTMNKSEFSLH